MTLETIDTKFTFTMSLIVSNKMFIYIRETKIDLTYLLTYIVFEKLKLYSL